MFTNIGTVSLVSAIVCLAAAAAHVLAVRTGRSGWAALTKVAASSSFVLFAVTKGALATHYGRLVLAALVLSWIGDVMLLSRRSHMFIGGIGAFLLAHICFAVAFLSGTVQLGWTATALAVTAVAGYALYRWLRPRLIGVFAVAVPVYIAAIMLMVSFAVGITASEMPWNVAAGAVIFAVSDLFVARDRFVLQSFDNKLWGIPLYYIAQLMLAASVVAAHA